MYDYKMMETLKNCPDDQIKTIREMMKHDMMMISTIDAALAARQIGNLKHPLLSEYLKKPYFGVISSVINTQEPISPSSKIEKNCNYYFETVIEPLFRRSNNLPEWIMSYLESYPKSLTAKSIEDDFVVYVNACTCNHSRYAVRFISSEIKKNVMYYKIDVGGCLIERQFNLFDIEPSEAKTVDELAKSIFDELQTFVYENKITDLRKVKQTLRLTRFVYNVKFDPFNLIININDSLVDIVFSYKGNVITARSKTLSPYIAEEPKKKPSKKVKSKKVSKK